LEKILRTIFILSFLASCSFLRPTGLVPEQNTETTEQVSADSQNTSLNQIVPTWFSNIPETYVLLDKEGKVPNHPFFDVDPNWRSDQQLINYVLVSPAESPYQYDLDLFSGKIFKVRNNCSSDDVWGDFSDKINRPNFSVGIIPRIYNQQRFIQKIIIFNEKTTETKIPIVPDKFAEAKVLGSVILQYCNQYPCDNQKKWSSTQILVGIDSHNSQYSEFSSLNELKKVINWPYVKAFLENQYGTHKIGNKNYPSYRLKAELDFTDTREYLKKASYNININKLVDWRKSCFALYDSLWKQAEKIRTVRNGQQEAFYDLFRVFYIRDYEQFLSCQKIVRPANINQNFERHWFFAFLQAFSNLEQNGFYYSCKGHGWMLNTPIDSEHFLTSEIKELKQCQPADFEQMFNHSINAMTSMQNQLNQSYRYIEYDTQQGGSHQKLYTWIFEHNKKLSCDQSEAPPEIFPEDILWKGFLPSLSDD
jgi:hypothetical protein